ncbi:heme steroid binding protein [Colletotrichum karsti]|uniref:Heme steroid binding protein n=1 Tax=Colletotrichum karsti TaxID=1095194 RepID=A0A9P6LKM2_9PEZI|nr:heme steroid binding protein [Colletotrichum karsti]KAF9876898.1 heme steroid binding protein [Colletotrichum karsti]
MGYVGVSLIIASVVWVIVAPPPWIHPFMPPFLLSWHNALPPPPPQDETKGRASAPERPPSPNDEKRNAAPAPPPPSINFPEEPATAPSKTKDALAMPPPPTIRRPSPAPAPPTIAEPEEEEQTTPKAKPSTPAIAVPSFSLEPPNNLSTGATNPIPGRGSMPPPPAPSTTTSNSMMPPPPPSAPRGPVPPRLAAFPAMNSPQRARPVPNRGPASSSSSSLAPPPTHSVKPSKPSRKVILTPGHSPLDWARISGPNADLRNLPPSTPYLKVTPSMLKKMTGRKGKDAWMALGGRVYNITPYLPYHPAGEPELLRGAGRDGTKLFGEIHPWVNYETMLSACLVGLLVDEEEVVKPSAMDEMD